jgi:catechol 2,3-dioxygenase-like lactoylglutathione lyase family enzyme
MTDNIFQVTPFMHVPDLDEALEFMTGTLGFTVDYRETNYAYVSREGAGLRILEAERGDPFQPGNRRFAYYFDCRDVDALHAELRPKLDALPKGDVHGPADKPYRQRELLVLAPDGNLIAFGQAIRPADAKA